MRARAATIACTTFALACFAVGAAAQDTGGAIDTRAAIKQKIRELEGLVGGDMPAERQAVSLQWLADLYVSVGRIDDAERAYDRILAFYPYDTAASNSFATFLLDVRREPERALQVTHDAIAWTSSATSPSPYLGRTYELRARAFADAGRCTDALRVAEEAILRSDEDAVEDAQRTKVRCLSELGKGAEAKATLLALIGETGASNPEDEQTLIAMLADQKGRADPAEVDRVVAEAVADGRRRRAAALASEGAMWVELESSQRVRLEASLRGDGESAVLFVADLDSRQSVYRPFAQLFALDGITALTFDMRGQGSSRCDSLPSPEAAASHYQELPSDVAAAHAYLVQQRGIDPARIAIVAAGEACFVVERALHEHQLAPAVVYLSPVFAEDDRELASAVAFRKQRPTLVLASEEDSYAVQSARAFHAALTPGPVTLKIYQSAGHGVSILRDPAHFADVDAWVKDTLSKTPSGSRK